MVWLFQAIEPDSGGCRIVCSRHRFFHKSLKLRVSILIVGLHICTYLQLSSMFLVQNECNILIVSSEASWWNIMLFQKYSIHSCFTIINLMTCVLLISSLAWCVLSSDRSDRSFRSVFIILESNFWLTLLSLSVFSSNISNFCSFCSHPNMFDLLSLNFIIL